MAYKPNPNHSATKENGSVKSVKHRLKGVTEQSRTDTEIPIEGYLVLSLVNGQRKEYPTGRDAVENFLSVAREKVRRSKAR